MSELSANSPGTVWCRHTDKNGHQFVQEHRVWSKGFIGKLQSAAAAIGGDSKVEQITQEQFNAERKR